MSEKCQSTRYDLSKIHKPARKSQMLRNCISIGMLSKIGNTKKKPCKEFLQRNIKGTFV